MKSTTHKTFIKQQFTATALLKIVRKRFCRLALNRSFLLTAMVVAVGVALTVAPAVTPVSGEKAINQLQQTGSNDSLIQSGLGSKINQGSAYVFLNPAPTPTPAGPLQIAFQSFRDGNREVYVMNPDGSNQVRLTNNPATDQEPCIRADGSKIVFDSDRDGGFQIFVMNPDASNPVNLSNDSSEFALAPSLSPDSTKIAFTSFRSGPGQIYLMNADGTGQVNLTNTSVTETDPWFSLDGSKIAFRSSRDGNAEIYEMNNDGSNQIRLTNNAADDYEPAYSPDGSKIAFATTRDGNFQIYVMNADGTNPINLSNNPAAERHPTFSPDGSKIAFVSNRDGNNEIYVMEVDGTNQTRLTNNPASDFYPAWGFLPTPTPTDTDGDGVPDNIDNCPVVFNPDQKDTDQDNQGDACDLDDDNDNDPDATDCAPLNAAINHSAVEVCDGIDNDCDGLIDEGFPNNDLDAQADCVDADDDNDGVLDPSDNCPFTANPNQADDDHDGIGNACDPTPGFSLSQITGAGTTCSNFAAGLAGSVNSAAYSAKPRTTFINNVDPNVVFYWLRINAAAGHNTLIVNQAITTGNFSMLWMVGTGSNVFDSGCVGRPSTITQTSTSSSTGKITVDWNVTGAGVYYVGLKLDAKSFKGLPLPTPETVHFDFAATGVPGSTRGLDLVNR